MSNPIPIQTEPMEPSRRKWLEDKAEEAIREIPRIAELRQRLLALGGEAGVFHVAEITETWWVEMLLTRGTIFDGQSRLYRGKRGRCHFNSGRLWAATPERRQLVTGFALSDDGCWRPHSWVLEPRKKKPPVLETTEKRLLYYGVVLTPEEAELFWEGVREND